MTGIPGPNRWHAACSCRGMPRATKLSPAPSLRQNLGPAGVLALALLIPGGCDEPVSQKPAPSPQTTSATAEKPGAVASEKPGAAASEKPIVAYDRCYRECYTAKTNATNRETCKLECDSLAEDDLRARADPAARVMQQHLRGCLLGCWDDPKLSETNRETCLLTCGDDAEVAVTPPPKQELEVVPGTVLTPPAEASAGPK